MFHIYSTLFIFQALCFTDGDSVSVMPLAQDYKRLMENDAGPNTGGMGAYAPCSIDRFGDKGRINYHLNEDCRFY